jgi:hypothetical protein
MPSRSTEINFALYEGGSTLIERKRPCVTAEDITKELIQLGEAQTMRYAWHRYKRIHELQKRLSKLTTK